MSPTWTILGTIFQLLLAYLLFMVVVFSAAGIGSGCQFGRFQLTVLNLSMYVLPAMCAVGVGIVVYLHRHGGSAWCY